MSDIPTDWRGQLDLREELARIDRNRAETQKLYAEAGKFNREPWVLVLIGFLTGFMALLAAIVARLPELLHAMGVGQ